MSFLISSGGSILILPNPELGNIEGLSVGINHSLSMTGDNYTYIKKRSSDKRTFRFDFTNVGRGKLIETQEFYKLHGGEEVIITDQFGSINQVIFSSDPSFTTSSHSVPVSSGTGARDEDGNFTLEFIEAG